MCHLRRQSGTGGTASAVLGLLVCLCLVGQCLSRGMGRGRVNYHTIYAREAKPYSSIKFDKNLPYVPRYRYPIDSYVGKRGRGFGDESEEEVIEDVDPRTLGVFLKSLERYLYGK